MTFLAIVIGLFVYVVGAVVSMASDLSDGYLGAPKPLGGLFWKAWVWPLWLAMALCLALIDLAVYVLCVVLDALRGRR